MSFNTNINTLAHKLRKAHNISWGAALRMAYAYDRSALPLQAAEASSSVFGTWTPASLVGVAGHFWGLGKAYAEVEDYGRAKAMFSVSRALYVYRDEGATLNYRSFIRLKGVKEGMAKEALSYFIAAGKGELTARSQELINAGATLYAARIIAPSWTF